MMRINLLGGTPTPAPKKAAAAEGPPPTTAVMSLVFVGTLVVGLVVVGVLYTIWNNDIKRLQKEYDRERAEQARLAAIQAENQRYLAQIRELETRKNTTQMLLNSRVGPVELMTALGNTVNRTTDLYLLTVTPTGARLAIRGQSNSVDSIARFYAALRESGSFDDIHMGRWYQDDMYNRPSFKFELDCVFRSSAAAATVPAAQPAGPPRPPGAPRRAGM